MSSRRRATPLQIALSERRRMALELRAQGGNYREIAATLRASGEVSPDYDHTMAWRDCTAELKRLNDENASTVEEMRRLQMERYDALFAKQYESAIDGDGWAFDRCLAVMAKMEALYGLAAPMRTQQEVSGPGGAPLPAGSNITIYQIPDNGRDSHTGTT